MNRVTIISIARNCSAGVAVLAGGLLGCNTQNQASRGSGGGSSFVDGAADTAHSARSRTQNGLSDSIRPAATSFSNTEEEAVRRDAPGSSIRHVDSTEVLRLTRNAKSGTVVNVWATWCGPCREELPMLKALSTRLEGDGIQLLLVSVDESESEPKIPEMLGGFGFVPPFYVASRPLGAFKRALHPVWPGNIPVTFLFDRDAKRRYFWGGPVMEKEVAPILEGLIQGRPIDGEARFELAPGQRTD